MPWTSATQSESAGTKADLVCPSSSKAAVSHEISALNQWKVTRSYGQEVGNGSDSVYDALKLYRGYIWEVGV